MSELENRNYTKTYITQALFKLMESYDYHKITVMDIVKKAGVGRVTYYRNFTSKDDIILQYFNSQITEYEQKTFFAPQNNDDYKEIIKSVFKMFFLKKDILKLLLKSNLESLYLDFLNRQFVELFNKQKNTNKFSPYVFSGALYNLSITWLKNDCQESIDEITDALANAILH